MTLHWPVEMRNVLILVIVPKMPIALPKIIEVTAIALKVTQEMHIIEAVKRVSPNYLSSLVGKVMY